ncbi:hypothetical protein [Phenylobacterium sp.]|uniref:hypothetical protein n=1 Tax=Phenylobacterium sp. TaxID=1871053 RepID=UPI002F3FA74C
MRRAALVILLLLTAVGCQLAKPDPAAETTARALYDDLRLGHDESLLGRLPAQLRTPPALAQILRLRALIPPGEPTGSRVVASQVAEIKNRGASEAIAIQYDYPGRTALLQVTLSRLAGARDWQIAGVQVRAATDKQLAANRFTLAGKPPLQLGFLAYAVLVPLLMLISVIKVAATPGLRHKWIWVVLSFVGVCSLKINWTTGVLMIDWYTVQVVGAGAAKGASRFDPWILSATIPIGALLILGGLVASPRWARKPAAPSAGEG